VKRRRVFLLVSGAALCLLACNAITGAHDRFLETSPDDAGKSTRDRNVGEPIETDADIIDASALDVGPVDANSIHTITIPPSWRTPNDAGFTTDQNGTRITTFDAPHAVIFPLEAPNLPTSNYTVTATLLPQQVGEFGILTRVKADGSSILLGSKVSNPDPPQAFAAPIAPPAWEPGGPFSMTGDPYTFVTGARYKMKLVAQDDVVSGKIWRETDPEPSKSALIQDPAQPENRGRNVGFYTYGIIDVTLLDLTITYVAP
jgi:hypothetical protein